MTTILTHANKLAGTQAGQIFDYDEATEELRPRATFGYTQDIAEALRRNPIRKGEGVTGQAIVKRQPVQVPDIAAEGAYDSRLRDLIMDSGFRALLAVPLIRENQVMGALTIARTQPGEFPRQVIDLMTTFASQSALAMQNVRLFDETKEALEQQTATAEVLEVISASVADTRAGVRQDPGELQEAVRQLRARHRARRAGGPCHAGRPPRLGPRDSAGDL